VYPD
jgi:hypothetical protein